ncbi:MAG: hypothetical protein Q7R39_11080 [Dehalococcoidia bacterium]|nr:hypothetical protein [Dehalococcoidia bacterium]
MVQLTDGESVALLVGFAFGFFTGWLYWARSKVPTAPIYSHHHLPCIIFINDTVHAGECGPGCVCMRCGLEWSEHHKHHLPVVK